MVRMICSTIDSSISMPAQERLASESAAREAFEARATTAESKLAALRSEAVETITRIKAEHAASLRDAGARLARVERQCEALMTAAESETQRLRDEHTVEVGALRAVIVDLEASLHAARDYERDTLGKLDGEITRMSSVVTSLQTERDRCVNSSLPGS